MAKQQTEDQAIVKAGTTALAPSYDYGTAAGAGFDNQTSEDVSIPFLGVLQSLSPEIAGEPGERIKGAQVGDLINTVTKERFDGEKGIIFQPADTNHVFVEWKPRKAGGGFVAVHQLDSPVVAKAKADAKEFGKYSTPDGNDLIETFYVAGLLHREEDAVAQAANAPEPMIIAFTSTKIKVYKQIMTRLRTFKGRPPLFAHRLRIQTFIEKNTSGTFGNYKITAAVNDDIAASLIPPTAETAVLLAGGQELLKAYRGGAVKANHDSSAQGGAGGKKDDVPF